MPPAEAILCPEPIAAPYSKFEHITTNEEANSAVQAAIEAHIKDLLNVGDNKNTVGKSVLEKFTNGLM